MCAKVGVSLLATQARTVASKLAPTFAPPSLPGEARRVDKTNPAPGGTGLEGNSDRIWKLRCRCCRT